MLKQQLKRLNYGKKVQINAYLSKKFFFEQFSDGSIENFGDDVQLDIRHCALLVPNAEIEPQQT